LVWKHQRDGLPGDLASGFDDLHVGVTVAVHLQLRSFAGRDLQHDRDEMATMSLLAA
jgi:hypothetical protein